MLISCATTKRSRLPKNTPDGRANIFTWILNIVFFFPLKVVELLMTCTLYLVVSTSLLSDSLSGAAVPRSMCSLVSLMFLLPCLLLTDLRPVSTLSLLCSLAHILIRWSAGSCFDRILTGTPGWVESHDRFASFLILTRHFFFCLCITATCFRMRGTVKCSMRHTSYPALQNTRICLP